MTTIRFENTPTEFSKYAKDFLESLGLAPERWLEAQAVDFGSGARIKIFDLAMPVPVTLLRSKEWVCRIETGENFIQFLIGERIWGAAIIPGRDVGSLKENGKRAEWGQLACLNLGECSFLTDLGPLSGLTQLASLNLRCCESLTDLGPLSGLTQLVSLNLSGCESLTDFGPVSDLKRLKDLDLSHCETLVDLAPLSGLKQLKNLDLSHCRPLTDLGPLSDLERMTTLNLFNCESISELGPLSTLTQLTSLSLHYCSSIVDLAPLSGLKQLKTLDLSGCTSLINLGPVSGLRRLNYLDLYGLETLTDLGPLSVLAQLRRLSLSGCENLADLGPISDLKRLKDLDLSGCKSLTDLGPLSGLKQLISLNLSGCESLTDLGPLSNLTRLKNASLKNRNYIELGWDLDLSGCKSLTDLGPLSGLEQLINLNLSGCESMTDLSPLSGLTQLTSLELSDCESLTDIGPLSGLKRLFDLNLSNCESLTDLGALSGLTQLESLNLGQCESLTNLSPLSGLPRLTELYIDSCPRIRSLEPLRDVASLRELSSSLHPSVLAEVLAHAASLRSDLSMINEKSTQWLEEVGQFDDGSIAEQERFATTLGEAFSLLGEHPIELPYEAYLLSRQGFSAAPWKAWLMGTRKTSGGVLFRHRVERQDIAGSPASCVGGICGALPGETVPAEEQAWARDWLSRFEKVWGARARGLQHVSAEVCVAVARLGMAESLERWLDRFTDPTDPALLDPVQAALGRWQLGRGDWAAASRHAGGIHQPDVRDPLLAEIVDACWLVDPDEAGRLLVAIEDPQLAGALAVRLGGDPRFTASCLNVDRLLVSCGDSPQAVAILLERLSPDAEPSLIQALSATLQAGPERLREWRRERLLRLLGKCDP